MKNMKQQLPQCKLVQNQVTSPLGPWSATACNDGLHSVKLSSEVTNENFLDLGSKRVRLKNRTENEHMKCFELWMQSYFGDKVNVETLKNSPTICEQIIPSKENEQATFRQKVFVKLQEYIKFGQTISYGDLAKLCSKDKSSAASRAVGSAMANNPISLVIPCHRVIKSDGRAGNYSKCTKNSIKLWLLSHERI